MSPRTKTGGVASFDPRLIQLWKDGALAEVIVPSPDPGSRGEAHHFRHTMYRLRLAMKREQHPDYAIAETASISLIEQDKGGVKRWCILIRPPDSKYSKVLSEAGYTSVEPPPLD